jgi:hypothetical protein
LTTLSAIALQLTLKVTSGEKIYAEYQIGQIGIEEFFISLEDMFDFIQLKFPIKK